MLSKILVKSINKLLNTYLIKHKESFLSNDKFLTNNLDHLMIE